MVPDIILDAVGDPPHRDVFENARLLDAAEIVGVPVECGQDIRGDFL